MRAGGYWTLLVTLLFVATACGNPTPSSSGGTPTPPGEGGSSLTLPALKLAVLKAVGGHLNYCDPDTYPISRGPALANARARLPAIRSQTAVFEAILQHEGLSADQNFNPDQLVAISDDYKQMSAIQLKPADDGYAFDLQVLAPNGSAWHVTGTVNRTGAVKVAHREPGLKPKCPVCLAAGVRIATPNGNVAVQDVRVGMPVWTTDRKGRRIAGTVLETGHMHAPLGHEVVRLKLRDGRTVVVSPGHPTADGRTVGGLEPGDSYDGTEVARATLIPYTGVTWDLLPSGPTGTYFADGVLLGSTLSSTNAKL